MGDNGAITIKMINNADDSDGENRDWELGVQGQGGLYGQ